MTAVKIGASHPLFLGQSDTPGSVLIPVKLTGSENYGLWSRSMRIALLGKRKLGFVLGTCTKASVGAQLHDQWETCNAIVLSWLMNTVSADLLNGIVYASDAYLVWEDLKESFDKVNRVRIWQLHRENTTLMQGTNSVSTYFSKLKELWSEYDVLVPSPSCGCEKSKDYIEHLSQQRLLHFLSGLNESYDQARRQILMKSITPSLGQAYAMIIQDESQQVTAANIAAKTAEKMESLALQASNLNLQVLSGEKSQNSEAQSMAKPDAELISEEMEVLSLAVSFTISERLFEGDLSEGKGLESCILAAGTELVAVQSLASLRGEIEPTLLEHELE
ncbi:uncharacterized protein LOC125858857 [Solanum stenotomum]|uniref:uncharacterized protein LOC125858857 n=1 Tax=Solanum stenotomum TaxID=172797 RepID=UPI0020D06EBC|nr:uncharacterized protein LOC125858857 [Solanum stenotomum]